METLKEISITIHKEQVVNDVMIKCNVLADEHSTDKDSPNLSAYLKQPDGDDYKPIVARSLMEGFARIKKTVQRYLKYGSTDVNNRLERIIYYDNQSESGYKIRFKDSSKQTTNEEDYVDAIHYTGGTYTPSGIKIYLYDSAGTSLSSNVTFYIYGVTAEGKEVNGQEITKNSEELPNSTLTNYLLAYSSKSIVVIAKISGVEVCRRTLYTLNDATGETLSNDYLVTLEMPQNFNIGLTKVLTNKMHEFMVAYTMFKFLLPRIPDEAVNYKTMSVELLQELLTTLNARVSSAERNPSWS